MTPETESGSTEESKVQESPSAEAGEQPAMGAGAATQEQPKAEGKRTQLKIVRENIDSLSKDVENFRKSHEASSKALEARIAALKKQLEASALSKDLDKLAKSHSTSDQKLQKQVTALKAEVAALKGHVTKEVARSRTKEDAMLARILAKVSTKPKLAKPKLSKPKLPKPSKPKPTKKA